MTILYLPICPICGAQDRLVRQVIHQADDTRTTYTCWDCGSVLAWLGDDLWVQSDRWAYQRIGREDKGHLLHKPLSAAELQELAQSAPKQHLPSDGMTPTLEVGGAGSFLLEHAPESAEVTLDGSFAVGLPVSREGRSSAAGATMSTAGGARVQGVEGKETAALVPMAQFLPEGMTLALVRYDGSRVEPVAVFHDGQLRALPSARRRGRGSPLLVISVGLTLLCLLCSVTAVVLSWFVDSEGVPLALPVAVPVPAARPASAVAPPPEAPFPTPTVTSPVVIQGVTDSGAGPQNHVIVGEVVNVSGRCLRFVEIRASYYDAGGQLVATGSTAVELDAVEVDGSSPFKLSTQGLPPSFQSYKLRVDYVTSDQAPLHLDVVRQEASRDDAGAYRVSGVVRNPHGFPVKLARVVATYYSSANQVVGVEKALNEADTLQPGQTWPFDLVLENPPSDLSHYKLQTEAVQP